MEDAADGAMDFIVIDSIQTMYIDNIDSAPGTVSAGARRARSEIIRVGQVAATSAWCFSSVT